MRRKRQRLYLLVLFLSIVGAAACGTGQEDMSEYKVYYVNKENTKTVAKGYEPKAEDDKALVQEFLEMLFQSTETKDYHQAVPKEVWLESWRLENSQLFLYFSGSYMEMECERGLVPSRNCADFDTSKRCGVYLILCGRFAADG